MPVERSTIRRMLANIGLLGVSQITARIVGFALTVVLARYLGKQGFGQYIYAFSWLLIGRIMANFGINRLVIREVAKDRRRAGEYFATSLTLKLGLAFITIITLLGLSAAIGIRGTLLEITALFLLLLPFQMVLSSCGTIFQAYERMGMFGTMDLIRVTLTLVGVLAMIPSGLGVRNAAFAYLGGAAITAVLSFWLARRLIQQPPEYSGWAAILRLSREAVPFLSIALVFVLQDRSSIVLLGRLQDAEQVAWYGAAYVLIDGLTLAALLVSTAAYPVFSRTWISNPGALEVLSDTILKYLALLGIGMGVGLFIVAPEVTHLIYGSSYEEATIALRIFAVGIPVFFQRTLLGEFLTAVDRLRSLFLINLGALLLNLFAGWLIISMFGYRGAAAITVTAGSFALVGCALAAPKRLRTSFLTWYPRALVASLFMGIVIVSLGPVNLFLKMGTGVVTYLAGLLTLRCLTGDELRQIASVALSRA